MTTIKNVAVLGGGVLGSQIAFQAAFRGFDVTIWDIDEAATTQAREKLEQLATTYADERVDGATADVLKRTLAGLDLTTDIEKAVAQADLVIEAGPEDIAIKRELWGRVGAVAPTDAIFATNTSTLLPSSFSDATGRPEKFLALHYANRIWERNVAEVMGTAATDPAVLDAVEAFAEEQGMVPVRIRKEKPAYIMNNLLMPVLNATAELLIDDIADIEDIDKTWRITQMTPLGPFQLFDLVGMTTVYNVYSVGTESQRRFAELVKRDYLDKGKLGVATGEGFYIYDQQ